MQRRRFEMLLAGFAFTFMGDAGLAVPPPEILDAMESGLDDALKIGGDSDKYPNGAGSSRAATAFTSHRVALVSQVPNSAFPSGSSGANEVWGYVSPGGREYGILGMRRGTGFVDITDPANPVIVGDIAGNVNTIWRDMATYGEYAYIVTDGSGIGMQVVDLTDIDNGNVSLATTMTQSGFSRAHNVFVNAESGYAYAVGGNLAGGGIIVIDVNVPSSPQIVATWNRSSVHDIFVHTFQQGNNAGREIAFCFAGSRGLKIVDVTDKSNIFLVSTYHYPNRSYCHQGWLSENEKQLYVNDEGDELSGNVETTTTYIINVRSLTDPSLSATFTNGQPSVDHNLVLRNGYVFEANYSSGLRIYDATDPNLQTVTEVGYFDTYPAHNSPGYSGAWGVFAEFPSGLVVVSDQSSGLFVLDPSQAVGNVGGGGDDIPTTSTWGVVVLCLLFLVVGSVLYDRLRSAGRHALDSTH
ncbi:MAG: choice-of-anchor B family protein [Planctomycetes bacterium]|nr:choice-of-anchor B family protein [Planctomycetota bacterium]